MSIHQAVVDKRDELDRKKVCRLGYLLDLMSLEDHDAVMFALDNKYPAAWLSQIMRDNGYSIGKTAVSDHIARRCSCDHSE